jgi:hypothetical protein
MPTATQHLRKLRGGSQSHLLKCDDGHYYAVKFLGNPQGNRVLVNEWVAAQILERLGIETPGVAVVTVTEEFLERNLDLTFELGVRQDRIRPSDHFGSEWVVADPGQQATHDYLPDTLLAHVVNLRDFLGMLAADKWLGNYDGRQCVFAREGATWRVWMIDHGYMFGGPEWEFTDWPLAGLYCRPLVYDSARTLEDFEPWLSRIEQFSPAELRQIAASAPAEWPPDGDRERLDELMNLLVARRRQVRALLLDTIASRGARFVNWGQAVAA